MIKAKTFFTFLLLVGVMLVGCEKKQPESKVQENGLTKDINDLVPQSIIDQMQSLGMPIHGGDNPPSIENTYLAAPFILLSSNVPGDFPGKSFADYEVTFYDQNNDDLTIKVDYLNGPESGTGLGCYIVGDKCKFSVFVEINSMNTNGTKAKMIHVISGTFIEKGIEDLHLANFMLDDYGDPSGIWIGVGEGRVAYDQDGFSEIVGSTSEWYSRLPACPCTYEEVKKMGKTDCPEGEWKICGDASLRFHYGATYEVRWTPVSSGKAGQQCTYDSNGKLITSGIAAGSPDMVSPGTCGPFEWLSNLLVNHLCDQSDHCIEDVKPWLKGNEKSIPCWQYLAQWPSNNLNSCDQNPKTDILHMLVMVGNMACEEVTDLFRVIDSSGQASTELKDFFHGRLNYTPANLKSQLQTIFTHLNCDNNLSDPGCSALKKAIGNL
ncbi:MAG: hypothetical protein DYG98_12510 [Haliscomenobacteraceae bacterium CHB4]|nr:hypothetical protein [Saprospiraceae bacterium]MCE7923873.1 hypothetical protein [Haliscomenobacteraceae bacterium CHB4]